MNHSSIINTQQHIKITDSVYLLTETVHWFIWINASNLVGN